jgi:hypothetical protein
MHSHYHLVNIFLIIIKTCLAHFLKIGGSKSPPVFHHPSLPAAPHSCCLTLTETSPQHHHKTIP